VIRGKRRSKARQGEARQGEAGQSEATPGQARQGEARLGQNRESQTAKISHFSDIYASFSAATDCPEPKIYQLRARIACPRALAKVLTAHSRGKRQKSDHTSVILEANASRI
jgi:hypothetical protein